MLHLKSFKAKLIAHNPIPQIIAQTGSPKDFPSSSKAHPSFLHKRPPTKADKRGGPLRLNSYALKKRAQVPSPDFKEGSHEWEGKAASWEWSGENAIEHSANIMSKRSGLVAGLMESKMKSALRVRKVLR